MRKTTTSIFRTVVSVAVIITLSGCNKTSSDFTLNKYEYSAGEMVELTNNNPLRNQIWELVDPAGTVRGIYYERNPQIIIPLRSEDGSYTIYLYDNKKEQEKKITSSKNILVKSIRGKLNIYSGSWAENNFKVTIDGEFMGSIHEDEFILEIPVGFHFIEIKGRYSSRKETIEIIKNQTVYIGM